MQSTELIATASVPPAPIGSADDPSIVRVTSIDQGDAAVLTVSGELDLHTSPVLLAAVEDSLRGGATRLTIEMDAVEFLDSTGLRALLRAQEHAAQVGTELQVGGLSAAARRLLELTGTIERLKRNGA